MNVRMDGWVVCAHNVERDSLELFRTLCAHLAKTRRVGTFKVADRTPVPESPSLAATY